MPLVIQAPKFCQWLNIGGIALVCVIIVNDEKNKILINHEMIHIRQWQELFYVGFLAWYLWEQLSKGYRDNCFEKEAYANQHDLNYLRERPRWAFLQYN